MRVRPKTKTVVKTYVRKLALVSGKEACEVTMVSADDRVSRTRKTMGGALVAAREKMGVRG